MFNHVFGPFFHIFLAFVAEYYFSQKKKKTNSVYFEPLKSSSFLYQGKIPSLTDPNKFRTKFLYSGFKQCAYQAFQLKVTKETGFSCKLLTVTSPSCNCWIICLQTKCVVWQPQKIFEKSRIDPINLHFNYSI